MIYLDTHAAAWLYAGLSEKFSEQGRALVNEHDIGISPIVRLELQFLFEVQRIGVEAVYIVTDLERRIGLQVGEEPFNHIVSGALSISWTRDPFDRLIVAHASLNDNILLSRDRNVLENYAHARW